MRDFPQKEKLAGGARAAARPMDMHECGLISARRKVSAVSAGDGSPVYGTLEIIEGGFCTSPSRRSGTFLQAALLKMLDCLNMDPMMLRPLEYRKGGSRKARVAERANRDAD
jgi:hypothetical protein